MAKEDDELRARARSLVDARREEPAESLAPKEKPKRDVSKVVTGGVSGAALLAVVVQLLQARVTPAQISALQDRIDVLENNSTKRRQLEYARDIVENCRSNQQDDFLRMLLPRRDAQVGFQVKPWFDVCPDLPEPTTGVKPPPK